LNALARKREEGGGFHLEKGGKGMTWTVVRTAWGVLKAHSPLRKGDYGCGFEG